MISEFQFETDVEEISELKIQPKGWYPVTIEYGVAPLVKVLIFKCVGELKAQSTFLESH